MKKKLKNYGFIPDVVTPDQYTFGAQLSPTVYQKNGQWDKYLPITEVQRNEYFDTHNCTAYGSLNQIEIFVKRVFKQAWNKSERYVGFMADTRPPGNSPHKVLESIRHGGLVDEELLPFTNIKTVEEYYSLGDNPGQVRGEGEKWLDAYEFGHDWVFSGGETLEIKQERMKKALKSSPLSLSVCAWKKNGDDLYYKKPSDEDNHWVCCYGYEEGEYWKIFDSYDSSKKKLAWDYNFGQCKRIQLAVRTTPRYKPLWFVGLIKNIWAKIYR